MALSICARPRATTAAALSALAAAVVLAYLPAVDGEFVFDDLSIIGMQAVRTPFEISPARWWGDSRPLATATFAADHAAFGLDPRGWHLTNLAVHLAAVLLAFGFARRTLELAGVGAPELPALAAAGMFALHPIQTESVAYVTQRSEALASAFVLAALLVLLRRDRERGAGRRALLLGAAAVLQVMGLATKPIAATVPALWLACAALLPAPGEEDVPPLRRALARLPAALPLFALSAVAAWGAIAATQGEPHAGFDIPGLSPGAYVATELRVVPRYLALLAWPSPLVADRAFPASQGISDPAALGWGAALLLALGACRLASKRLGPAGRTLGFGAIFFAIAIAPSSSFVPLLDPMTEHRLYVPSLGVFIAAAACATALLRRIGVRRSAPAGAVLAVAVLGIMAAATARRAAAWSTAIGLWTDGVAHAPEKARVQLNLGYALAANERHEEALARFGRAMDLAGDASISRDTVLLDVVDSLVALGRLDDARRAVAEDSPAGNPLGPALLARVDYAAGDDLAAARQAREALAAEPGFEPALRVLGMAQLRAGAPAVALVTLRRAANGDVVDPGLFLALGEAEARAGDPIRACRAWLTAGGQPGSSTSAAARAALRAHACSAG